MLNPTNLDKFYTEYFNNLSQWAHDGIVNIDLATLYNMRVLQDSNETIKKINDLIQYFHVIENSEKVTLFNSQFIIWITPKMNDNRPLTYVLIALNQNDKPHLETVFVTEGVYNSPRLVLKVLQKFLIDMIETEATLTLLDKPKQ